jgi:hypothetical protein
MRNKPTSRTLRAVDAFGAGTRTDDQNRDLELGLSSEEHHTPKVLYPQDKLQGIHPNVDSTAAPASIPISNPPIPICQSHPQSLPDLSKFAKPYSTDFCRVRAFSVEHMSQELEALSHKVFEGSVVSKDDLDRLRVLLHAQGQSVRQRDAKPLACTTH